jgi:hypothetical protein
MSPSDYVAAIRQSGLSIYDPIEIGSPLYIPSADLEALLNEGLAGTSTAGLPIRTRSKVVKSRVCEVLGYPIPATFKKTQPRFFGQNLDTYTQASNNLQIWNEELSPTRRYALIREENGVLTKVRVVTGDTLAELDTTGTLTQKYQARLNDSVGCALVSQQDTERVVPLTARTQQVSFDSPTGYPAVGELLPIKVVYERLFGLVGTSFASFADLGRTQERNRGAALHRLICARLQYSHYADDGRFPDIKHQLLEVKLQTSPTIDLGLVSPDSADPLDIPKIQGTQIRHCDVRYAVFSGTTDGANVTLKGFYLSTGRDFFSWFPRFEGRILNKKLQIPLPRDFL